VRGRHTDNPQPCGSIPGFWYLLVSKIIQPLK
jgi:hypothetical protein